MYFVSLKSVSYTIGIFYILVSSAILSQFIISPTRFFVSNKFHNTYPIDAPISVLIGLFLLINILLLYGISKKKPHILFLWLVFSLIFIVSKKILSILFSEISEHFPENTQQKFKFFHKNTHWFAPNISKKFKFLLGIFRKKFTDLRK